MIKYEDVEGDWNSLIASILRLWLSGGNIEGSDEARIPWSNTWVLRIRANWARSIIVGLARWGGYSVGIVASQPMAMAGGIDVWAAVKAARFVRFCDAFNIPIIYLQDTPAYIVGTQQERLGMIYRGATPFSLQKRLSAPLPRWR